MIKGFASRETEELFRGRSSRRIPADVQMRALRKLLALNAAPGLDDLGRIPGNRLEKLKGDRAGRYAIRVNDQWRVCFAWRDGDAYEVEIVDLPSLRRPSWRNSASATFRPFTPGKS